MHNKFYLNLENIDTADNFDLDECIDNLQVNSDGLVPVITQCAETNKVLMFAWMNRDTLRQTIETKTMTYWSRSRQKTWIKGETSGHKQVVEKIYFDCDGDAILCLVKQIGSACHTHRKSCFYLEADLDKNTIQLRQNL